MKRSLFVAIIAAALLTGCGSLFPKRVEFGQDKVEKFPVPKSSETEAQRQAAQRAKQEAARTLEAALAEQSSPAVVEPARGTARLTDSLSLSLGPPVHPAPPEDSSDAVARRLDLAIAKLNRRIDDFKHDNDENAGRKIEGTGWLSIPYFVWIGGVAVVGFIGFVVLGVAWTALKAFSLSNPPLALGLNAVQLGGRGAVALAKEVIHGGEVFKDKIEAELPEIADKVKSLFASAQKEAQSPSNQVVVQQLTS